MTFYDGNYAVAIATGVPRKSFAFEQETNTIIVEQDYQQKEANFAAEALGNVHPSDNTLYLIHESPRQPVGGDIVQWTRFYAKIPEQRSEYESYALKIPGLHGNEALIIRRITANAANSNASLVNLTAAGHGFANGDGITIEYHVIQSGNPTLSFTRQVFRIVEAVTNSNAFVTNTITDFNTVNFHAAWSYGTRRQPRSEKVNSRVQFDYYLPGVTNAVNSAADIPILQPTKILNFAGDEVDIYSDSTSPTQQAYLANTVGTEVVVEESILRIWRGPIYERQTRYAEAR
jgi:hypothetical protein